jgi:hypothetical protein
LTTLHDHGLRKGADDDPRSHPSCAFADMVNSPSGYVRCQQKPFIADPIVSDHNCGPTLPLACSRAFFGLAFGPTTRDWHPKD